MKKSRFTESQIMAILKQHEVGIAVAYSPLDEYWLGKLPVSCQFASKVFAIVLPETGT